MAFKFFNIGRANEEITRLETENAALRAAKPAVAAGPEAAQLAEALASNEQISTQAAADVAAADAKVVNLTAQLEVAQGQVNSLGATIKAACIASNVEVPANATSTAMVALLQGSVAATAARKALEITAAGGAPAAAAAAADAKTGKTALSGMAKILAAAKTDLKTAGYVAKQVS